MHSKNNTFGIFIAQRAMRHFVTDFYVMTEPLLPYKNAKNGPCGRMEKCVNYSYGCHCSGKLITIYRKWGTLWIRLQ